MQRTSPSLRSLVTSSAVARVAILSIAVMAAASAPAAEESPSLSERLSQLRQSWTGEPSPAVAAAGARPSRASRDLFDALGGQSAGRTPRVALRDTQTLDEVPTPSRSRAGSVLGKASAGGGIDLGTALGGTAPSPVPEKLQPIPTPTADGDDTPPADESSKEDSGTTNEEQADTNSDAAPAPQSVAANPMADRRRDSSDLALDLISSTASSRDTTGVGAQGHNSRSDSPADLFPLEKPATTNLAKSDSGFATASDAAAKADSRSPVVESSAPTNSLSPSRQMPDVLADADAPLEGTAVVSDEHEPVESNWNELSPPDPQASDRAGIANSPLAERAFSNPAPPATASEREVWISTPGSPASSLRGAGIGDNVLMSEQLPLITSRVVGPSKIMIGREAKYQVKIENRGDAAADQLSTEIVAPEWADVIHATASSGAVHRGGAQAGSNVLDWDIASLGPGSSQTLDLVLVPKTSQPLNIGVSWQHAPVASTTTVEVQEPKLAMSISGPDEVFFGRPQAYRLSLSNPGTGAADNVVVQLMPPGGGQAVSSYRVESLAPGEAKVVDIEITAREPGELAIQAVAVADGNLRTEAEQQIFCRQAELNVDWRGPQRKYAGTQATYYFRVRNPGTAAADQVELKVALPRGFEFISASDGHQVDRAAKQVTWKIGTLRPGDDCYLELRGEVNQAGKNELRLSASNAGGDVHDTKVATTEVVALADLELDVSDPKGPVPVGSEVDYEIMVTNRGRSTAEDVNIVGLFSAGIEPVTAEGAEANIADGRVGFRTIGSLPAGQKVRLRIRARAQSPGTHLFRAEVVCRDLEIKLAAEETTRFFQDESTPGANGAALESASRAARFE